MTLPPERLGDKGQRYEIIMTVRETGVEQVFGWATTQKAADEMLQSVNLWPYTSGGRIVDRQANGE